MTTEQLGKAEWGLMYRIFDSAVSGLGTIVAFRAWGLGLAMVACLVLSLAFHFVGKRFGLNG